MKLFSGLCTAFLLVLFSNTTHAETYYFHNDHLVTPQALTDKDQNVVWQAEYDPFGKATETVSEVEQNLRFPGQYLDRESGLHYNYYRTYDSELGRYTQSDPIGLAAGLGTYPYVKNNPVRLIDPLGLYTCVFVARGPSGGLFDTHAGVYASRGGAGGAGWFYDPAGSFGGEERPGGGLFDELLDQFNLDDYQAYHQSDGGITEMSCKDTTEEEERNMFELADRLGDPIGGFCANNVSDVVRGNPHFTQVGAWTFKPSTLMKETKASTATQPLP